MGVKGWTVVYQGPRLRVEIVAAMLEARGLTTEVFGDNIYGVGLDFTDARLMVPEEQAELARRVIKEAEQKPLPEDV